MARTASTPTIELRNTRRTGPIARAIDAISAREREVRDTLWLLVALAWILAPMAATLPFWASAASLAFLGWRATLTWTGQRLPPRWVLVTLLLVSAVAVMLRFHTIFGKDAGVTYVVLLLGLKLLELRARRDIFVVICLSLFIMLTSLFESQNLSHALWMMVGVGLLVAAMVRVNYAGAEPPLRAKLVLAGQMCALALPLMVVLFILFPRVQGPLWGMPSDAFTGHTGLSESMEPGSFDRLVQSGEIAFQVEFKGRTPTPSERYWRGPVLGFFDGSVWRPMPFNYMRDGNQAPVEVDRTSSLEYVVTTEPTNRAFLYLLDAPASPPEGHGVVAVMRPDLQIALREPLHERTAFVARSFTRFHYGADEDARTVATWLQLPPGNPRTRALAQEIRAGESDPRRQVATVLRRFRTEQYFYTLNPPLLGRDSIDQFLFETRRGFCEHYAGSFVFLARALGIPARVVTGYQGGDINPLNGQMTVRQSDAHAWAEVWYADTGWTRVDPTAAVAPDRIERGFEQGVEAAQGLTGAFSVASRNWMRYLLYDIDALNNVWNRRVVSYSSDEQQGLFRNWGMPDVDWHGLAVGLIIVFGLVAGVLATQVILRRPRVDPVQAVYSRLCEQLEKRGVARRPDEGPQDYLQRATPFVESSKLARVRRAFAIYQLLRYGRSAESPQALLRGFKACVNALRL